MDIRRKNLVRRTLIVLLILLVAIGAYYLLRTFVMGNSITSFYTNDPKKITKVEIMSGNTGEIKTITSQEEIKTITDYLSGLKFIRRYPADSTGWVYRVTAYTGDKELVRITDKGNVFSINDKSYEVKSSKDSSLNDLLDGFMN